MVGLAQSVEIPQQNVPPLLAKGSFWRSLILFGLVLWLYAPVLTRLAAQWWADPNFSHGVFVPAVSLYVVWVSGDRLLAIKREPAVCGVAGVLCSSCTLILGVFCAEWFLWRMSRN